ncbi:DUF423 domain-containing protein [Pyruvatibacter sp. HU-CL02332]|uniref:DUF423 domain-containing protein n=1 Tax=Pyruvatibacter sp. HU-CL02332 TaxID=3127650 RepID=UPI00310B450A
MKLWLTLAALNGFIAVAAGAFGAHGLQGRVGERALAAFETGAQYHMYHALALIGVAWLASISTQTGITATGTHIAGWAFLTGIILFSGSLYFYGLTESRALVLITPLGGLAFLVGWGTLLYAAIKST